MKISEYLGKTNDDYGCDDFYRLVLETDKGKKEIGIHNLEECPEDALLSRDLGFVYDIPSMLLKAYEAGKRGEAVVVSRETDVEE